MSHFSSALDAALRYAEAGWHVFPCRPDKRPHTEHGFLEATTDDGKIIEWWRRWPNAQVGIAAEASGICVVDLDMDTAKGKDGIAVWTRLCDQHGMHGCSLIATTPRGGRHYVYRCPEKAPSSRVDVIKGSGIDVRCAGGYIVAPSPASPGRTWEYGDPFSDRDIQPMVSWVADLVGEPRERRSAALGIDSAKVMPLDPTQRAAIIGALPHIPNDSRDEWLRVGMALKSTGAGQEAYDLWEEWSQACGEPGRVHPKYNAKDQAYQWRSLREFFLDGREVSIATLFHMAKQGGWMPSIAQEIGLQPAEVADDEDDEFPTIQLDEDEDDDNEPEGKDEGGPFKRHWLNIPGLLGDITQWMIDSSPRQQPALCLASAIATLGAIMGRRVSTPSDLRTNVYTLGIGPTACGKDASVKYPSVLLTYAGLDRFIGPGEWRSDAGLRAALADQPSHCAYVDEFTKMLALMGGKHVSPYLAGIKGLMLRCFTSANSVLPAAALADRKLNPPTPINQPNLCVYGTGVPSDLFASLDRNALRDGLLNRFLVFYADEDHPPRRDVVRAVPPTDLVDRIKQLARDLQPSGALASMDGSMAVASQCRVVPMEDDATALLREFGDWAEHETAAKRKADDPLADLWCRAAEHAAKIALIRAVGDSPSGPIRHADIDWACSIVTWCTERTQIEARGKLNDSSYEAQVQQVLAAIKKAGQAGITSGRLARKCRSVPRNVRGDALRDLAESGDIGVLRPPKSKAGRPTATYVATRHQ
jgi:hypothetical protein